MPYSKWSEINDALKGIKPKISLAQANVIAKWADAMEQAEDGPESPWAAAIAQFKKLYQVQGDKWVKRKQKESAMPYRGYFTSGTATVEVRAIKVNGEAIPVAELVAAYEKQRGDGQDADGTDIQEAAMKTVDGKKYPASDFLVVEDSEKVDPWGKEMDVDKVRGLLQEALAMLDAPIKEGREEIAEAELSESASGHALTLAETDAAIDAGPRAPLLLDFALMKPGRGNKKDNHYYPREVLERDAHVFEGVKMYATDHRQEEKSVRTEVGIVKTCPLRFEGDGTPIGRASIFNPDFAEQVRNRAKAGVLDSLENSILGTGKTKAGKTPDGEKANIVEAITKGISVDFVTKGGAGGQARALIESDTGGVKMEKEQIEKLLSESGLPQDAQERLAGAEYADEEAVKEAILKEKAQEPKAPQKLAEADVEEAVGATKLPDFAKIALKARDYADEAELKEAIAGAVKEVAKLTGSGQPFGQGGGTAPGNGQMSEADYDAAYADILARHGLHVPQQEVT